MRFPLLFFGILLCISFFQACETHQTKKYDSSLVKTYAELSLLYEKEKMTEKISDSLYQIKVAEFFTKKGMKESDFRRQSEELMEDYKTWKLFLTDVSRALDSLKAVKK
ncbi:MAG: hypothetical protein H3C35_12150 [Bacteroidetes bacterium]|nr:hypothetical protein [Bacteroidota bacterium]